MSTSETIAKTVLETQINGLKALIESLSSRYDPLVQVLVQTKGRIIVTGMGKSGHVGRKIAATFSSTGTPAHFVHPGEASHGDLGMIAPNDSILALSKSGETAELGDLLGYALRFSIPVIAITAGAKSSLVNHAKVSFILPSVSEACEITNAPTTSTTMMMALGDALAISLMRQKGLTATDFHRFHPGGMLGAALRKVEDLMHQNPGQLPLCDESQSTQIAIETLSDGGFGCVGVIDKKGHLTGILTDGDVRRLFGQNIHNQPISQTMTRAPKTVTPDTVAGDALALMSMDKITSLFVLENGKPVGLLHIHDCLASGVI